MVKTFESELSEFENLLARPWIDPARLEALASSLPLVPAVLQCFRIAERSLQLERSGRGRTIPASRSTVIRTIRERLQSLDEAWLVTTGSLRGRAKSHWAKEVLNALSLRRPVSIEALLRAADVMEKVMEWPPGCIVNDGHGRIDGYNLGLGVAYVSLDTGVSTSVPLTALAVYFSAVGEGVLSEEMEVRINEGIDHACALRAQGAREAPASGNRWRLLPRPPEDPDGLRAFLSLQSCGRFVSGRDTSRIERLASLRPSRLAAGRGEFDGYFAFLFDEIDLVVLECVDTGNAIYLLDSNWRLLSQKSKKEPIDDGWQRIIHRGDWFEKLSSEVSAKRQRHARAGASPIATR